MKPVRINDRARVYHADVLDALAKLKDNTFHGCLSDPPYGLSFMGKQWDKGVPSVEVWREVLRVLKPGAVILAFGGTRMFHRLAVAMEDAGFEIRDTLVWLYGSGFPKSMDISKAIDKHKGAKREKIRHQIGPDRKGFYIDTRPWVEKAKKNGYHEVDGGVPISDEAKQWFGFGTCLKPAWEPVILAMKPIAGTFAANVLEHGCGGLNIDGSRIGTKESEERVVKASGGKTWDEKTCGLRKQYTQQAKTGRWPANLLLDDEVAAQLDEQSGKSKSPALHAQEVRQDDSPNRKRNAYGKFKGTVLLTGHGDEGGASPFFKRVAMQKREREQVNAYGKYAYGKYAYRTAPVDYEDQESGPSKFFQKTPSPTMKHAYDGGWTKRSTVNHDDGDDTSTSRFFYTAKASGNERRSYNDHPTVKPLPLLAYLAKLILPPGECNLLVPYSGSGSEMIAGLRAGWKTVTGIEKDEKYIAIAKRRIGQNEHAPGVDDTGNTPREDLKKLGKLGWQSLL